MAEEPSRKSLDEAGGKSSLASILAAAVALFVLGYPPLSMWMDLEPARTIIVLQAKWWSQKSEYGLFGTYASCLFLLLIPLVSIVLLSASVKALGRALRPTMDPWFLSRAPLFTERTRTRYWTLLISFVVLLLAGSFAWFALTDPGRLSWVGESGGLSIAICLAALLFAPVVLADAALPGVTKAGKIAELHERRSESGQSMGYELVLDEHKISVSDELSSRLRVGDSVLVRLSPLLDSLRELSKY